MITLTDRQIAEYFHRSYAVVDGLWFVKTEERHGFDEALEIDDEVWRVMPKIQARKIKEFAGVEGGLAALETCLATKLAIEGFQSETVKDADGKGFTASVQACPWCKLMEQAGRGHLAGTVGQRICNSEYRVWAAEFGTNITVAIEQRLCEGADRCAIHFREEPQGV